MGVDRNAVLQDYRRWLYYMAHHLAASPDDVDDLAQEGYIAMWRALDTFDPDKGALPPWLTKAAKMRMHDVVRRDVSFGQDYKRNPGSTDGTAVSLEALAVPELAEMESRTASALAEGTALAYHHGQIHAALQGLPEEQKQYVVMRFWCGMNNPEIQPLVEGNVHHLWHGPKGARARLRLALGDLAVA